MESCSISIGGIELIINFKKFLTDGNHENFDRLYAYPVEKKIRQTARFKKWFFGHYHDNRNVTKDELLLWEQIIRIS